MQLPHRRAGWALVAASSLGLTLSAGAQTPYRSSEDKVPTAAVAADVSAAEARLAEIKIELAWLADPGTFTCQLAARKVGPVLEIGGFVPNDLLRHLAFELARRQCRLPIVDKMVIHPNSMLPTIPDTHDRLCRSAASILSRTMADIGERYDFTADANGQVNVSGTITSWEEKLNVSRRLSQLPGCTCVVNNFTVKNVMNDGKAINLVSADGSLQVPLAAVYSMETPRPAALVGVPAPRVEMPAARVEIPTARQDVVPMSVSATPAVVSMPVTPSQIILPAPAPAPIQIVQPPAAPAVQAPPTRIVQMPVPKPVVAAQPPIIVTVQQPATTYTTTETAPAAPSSVPWRAPNAASSQAPPRGLIPALVGSPYIPKSQGGVLPQPVPPAPQNTSAAPVSQPVASAVKPVVYQTPAQPLEPARLPPAVQTMAKPQTPALPPYRPQAEVVQVPYRPQAEVVQVPYRPQPEGSQVPNRAPLQVAQAPYRPQADLSPMPHKQPEVVQAPYRLQPDAASKPAPTQPELVQAPYRPQPQPTQWRTPQSNTPVSYAPSGLVQATYKPQPVVQAPVKPTMVAQAPVKPVAPAPGQQLVSPYGAGLPLPQMPKSENAVATKPTGNQPNGAAYPPAHRLMPQPETTPLATPAAQPSSSPVLPPQATPGGQPGPAATMTAQAQVQILHRIEEVGGPAVRDARLQTTGGNQCVILLKVRSRPEGQEIGQKIMNLPELAPFKVDLQMQVEP